MFTDNLGTPELDLYIAGDTATTGTVTVPGISFSTTFSVTPGTVTTVTLPAGAEATSADGTESKGIHVTSASAVTVYGINHIQYTTDAYLGLPTNLLGTDYVVMAFPNTTVVQGTEFGIAATQDGTTVTITPTVTTGSRAAGTPYNVTLNSGQTYELRNSSAAPADLTGTTITSTAPIAVYGGQQCANVPNGNYVACNYLVEEIPPTSTWGRTFVTEPLATRKNGDTFRFLAGTNGTQVSVNGTVVATLNRGQVFEQIVSGPSEISATQPILVAQYSNSSSYDGVNADPFMMLIPPYEQFLASYTVTTPAAGYPTNYINVVAPTAGVNGIVLDGTAVSPAGFTAIGTSGFSGAQLSVAVGSHTITGTLPFGAFVYGYFNYDGYGYPGGMSLSPVAVVTSLSLAPKTATDTVGTQDCVTATVLDQNSGAVAGVRVDFAVTGPNAQLGFTDTATDGTAQFCYTGASVGTDTIVATVSNLTASATKTWTSAAPPTPPSCALTSVIAGPPKQLQITVQSASAGLQSVQVTESNNATVSVPTFTTGNKAALVVTATKINQSQGATVALSITDVNGQVTNCDPVVPGDPESTAPAQDDAAGGCNIGAAGGAANFEALGGLFLGLGLLLRRRTQR